jgi:hypothetical protein
MMARMNVVVSDTAPARRWGYPAKWVREESFWREMTTRTLSALVAAAVIFLAGRSAGLFHQVPWSTVGKTLVAGGVWVTGLSVAAASISGVVAWRTNRANVRARRHFRDIKGLVDQIVDSLDAHDAKRAEFEAQLAELKGQHREAVDEALRARRANEDATNDDNDGV